MDTITVTDEFDARKISVLIIRNGDDLAVVPDYLLVREAPGVGNSIISWITTQITFF